MGFWCSCHCPKHIDADAVLLTSSVKNVDGFHPLNAGTPINGNLSWYQAPAGIIWRCSKVQDLEASSRDWSFQYRWDQWRFSCCKNTTVMTGPIICPKNYWKTNIFGCQLICMPADFVKGAVVNDVNRCDKGQRNVWGCRWLCYSVHITPVPGGLDLLVTICVNLRPTKALFVLKKWKCEPRWSLYLI